MKMECHDGNECIVSKTVHTNSGQKYPDTSHFPYIFIKITFIIIKINLQKTVFTVKYLKTISHLKYTYFSVIYINLI
jgi:hypothetical protein